MDDLHKQLAAALREAIRAFGPYHPSWRVLGQMRDAMDEYNHAVRTESSAAKQATEKMTGEER